MCVCVYPSVCLSISLYEKSCNVLSRHLKYLHGKEQQHAVSDAGYLQRSQDLPPPADLYDSAAIEDNSRGQNAGCLQGHAAILGQASAGGWQDRLTDEQVAAVTGVGTAQASTATAGSIDSNTKDANLRWPRGIAASMDSSSGSSGPQREALLVLAGPGSGKTTVLSRRIQYLIVERRCSCTHRCIHIQPC